MSPNSLLDACGAALLLAVLSFVAQWRGRIRHCRDLEEIRATFERQKAESAAAASDLRREFAALEKSALAPPEPPGTGSLNRSTRARALQMLRTGISSETAAASLGVAKREMRLLERVSQTFYLR
jgi:type II secretory pathway component PulM